MCPHYLTVQTQTDMAAFAAGMVSDYKNPGAHGTGVHKILERIIACRNRTGIPKSVDM
ncbi:hypothetical protein DEV91_112180 [Phyllobacterium brassicacearum]|nr:hypothetical protein DEV91_112180 [Phyllobacterium brassicacearum]